MNKEYNSKVSSKNSKRLLKNLKNTTGGYFFAAPCSSGFCARQHICYSAYMLSPVRLSVCLSVTRVDQSKTVEVRIMQLSPLSSPMTLVSSWLISPQNSKGNIGSGDAK